VLQKILDWIDEAAGGAVRMVYLAAGVTAVAIGFGGLDLAGLASAFVHGDIFALVPWLVAFAVETQTYVTARHVSKDWHTLQSPVLEKAVKKATKMDLLVHLAALLLLVTFSVWNQLVYLVANWTPVPPFGLPSWVAYAIRAGATPLFFLMAAFLAPQAQTLGERMNAEAHRTLGQFLKVLKNQRKGALKLLRQRHVDMGQAIEAVGTAANEKKAAQMIALVQNAIVQLANGATPQQAAEIAQPSVPTVKLIGRAKAGSPQDRCRRAYRDGMTYRDLMKAAQVSESTAKRYIKQFARELSA
jgi:hypothetical protein